MDKIIAIHQPNFFPWLGYFNKIARCDCFVLLDNVQFSKKGGTYTNRVKILIDKKDSWITVPVKRDYHGVKYIKDIEINNDSPWQKKMMNTIKINYCKFPCYSEVINLIENLITQATNSLSEFNINSISKLCEIWGYKQKLILGSNLECSGSSTELLISLTKAVNGNVYMCGAGAINYQDDSEFNKAGLNLIYQNFHHPTYSQNNLVNFISGLSIIDVLFCCGFSETKKLIENNFGK